MSERRKMCILHDNEFHRIKAQIDSILGECDKDFTKRLNALKFISTSQYLESLKQIPESTKVPMLAILKLLRPGIKEIILKNKIEVEKLLEDAIKFDVSEELASQLKKFTEISESNLLVKLLQDLFSVVLDKGNKELDYGELNRLQKLTSDDQKALIAFKKVLRE